jgi:hypothetical protein
MILFDFLDNLQHELFVISRLLFALPSQLDLFKWWWNAQSEPFLQLFPKVNAQIDPLVIVEMYNLLEVALEVATEGDIPIEHHWQKTFVIFATNLNQYHQTLQSIYRASDTKDAKGLVPSSTGMVNPSTTSSTTEILWDPYLRPMPQASEEDTYIKAVLEANLSVSLRGMNILCFYASQRLETMQANILKTPLSQILLTFLKYPSVDIQHFAVCVLESLTLFNQTQPLIHNLFQANSEFVSHILNVYTTIASDLSFHKQQCNSSLHIQTWSPFRRTLTTVLRNLIIDDPRVLQPFRTLLPIFQCIAGETLDEEFAAAILELLTEVLKINEYDTVTYNAHLIMHI